MVHLGDFSEPLKCWSFFWRQGRTAGPMDREWPGVIRIHPSKARGGHGALAIPAPRAGTHRWHLPERQALAEAATPIAKGQPRWLRTALALLQGSGADSGLAGGELLLDRTRCVASKDACDPNHQGLRVVLWPPWCWSPRQWP